MSLNKSATTQYEHGDFTWKKTPKMEVKLIK